MAATASQPKVGRKFSQIVFMARMIGERAGTVKGNLCKSIEFSSYHRRIWNKLLKESVQITSRFGIQGKPC